MEHIMAILTLARHLVPERLRGVGVNRHHIQFHNMPKALSTKSKCIYAATIVAFLVGLMFVILGVLSVGCILCGVAISFAYTNAVGNGHIKPPKDNGSR